MKANVTGTIVIPVSEIVEVSGPREYLGAIAAATEQISARNEWYQKLGACFHSSTVKLVEGPLVVSVQWYDLHGPADVILATAAQGHVIDAAEADAIAERLARLGLDVVDRWNVGTERLSFKVTGRRGVEPFTAAVVAMLCGDRRVEEG